MIDPTRTTSVIFDFAGTLASGRYFEPLGQSSLDAMAISFLVKTPLNGRILG